ncbi:hypothetical protein [Flaviaesturariibacter amylovorans]|uniref:DUF4304 domain-containing protein n=1 Tax=Flaviaesturariibacter amylovorans TaxID=1084520 RepID=A0ABP8HUK3_9BACT
MRPQLPLHKNMTQPKQVLTTALLQFADAYLQSQGFRFSESQLRYTRSEGGFRQEISFRGSKNNMAGAIIDFQPNFLIYSTAYKKWHTTHFPELPVLGGGYIGGDRSAWTNFDRSFQPRFGYDFIRQDHEGIMLDLLKNVRNVALPYFDQNNSWEKIAAGANVQERERVDALILTQRPKDALALCSHALARMEQVYQDTANANYLQPIQFMKARKAFLVAGGS